MPGTTHKVASFKDPNIERQVVELVRGINAAIPSSEKGQPNGVATLDANGKVPESQLPPIEGMVVHGNEWHNPGFVSKTGDTMMGPLAMASYALTFGNRFRLVYNSTLGTLDVEVI